MSEGWRDARGDVGVPRMCSTKLERCDESGLGLEAILRAGGGGVRPTEDMELLREALLVSGPSVWSAIAATPAYSRMRGSAKGRVWCAGVG